MVTPAMETGISDHVWSLDEVMIYHDKLWTMKNIHWWGLALMAIGIALWMSGLSPLLCSIIFVIGLVGLVLAWITRF